MPSNAGIFVVPRDHAQLGAARRGRAYSEVAAEAGCSVSFLWELCHGVTRHVAPTLAARIEAALGASPGQLFVIDPGDAAALSPYYAHACQR